MSKLYVVGIGPGGLNHMTLEAREALAASDVVVGYQTYLDFITPLLEGKEVVSSGMMKEVERCQQAIDMAASGKNTAIVSSGDAGIYGMAGLILELMDKIDSVGADPCVCPDPVEVIPSIFPEQGKGEHAGSPLQEIDVVIIPGVSAVQAAASVLGAPLMHDFAVISLSDLMTPWETIRKRLKAAADADFVVALYNPRSKGRVRQIEEAREILLSRRSPQTPVGIVRNACRDEESKVVTTLENMFDHDIDMFSIVIIGNSATYVDKKGRMVTPRGYAAKAEGKSESTASLQPSAFSLQSANFSLGASRALFVGGTGSDVGKSVIAAGICRILKNRGVNVAPFKSQNMALNSAVTPEGGEIGRAQAVQAAACGILPHTDMNPVLLKPTTDLGSQVIIHGKVVGNMRVKEYHAYKPEAFVKIEESFARLSSDHDFIVIEGAGSIAEINLKEHDIANLRIAKMANAPVILVADIDRGGVFAQIVGTIELLDSKEKAMIGGIIINRFRGDASLLDSGIRFIEERTGIPVLGVVPVFTGFSIPEEDSVALEKRAKGEGVEAKEGKLKIGVLKLPRISNYTDFDPLEWEEDVELRYLDEPADIEGLDILILPGSKSTINDLDYLRNSGFFPAIKGFKGCIAGICGGFQILGRRVSDPDGVEALSAGEAEGLGLLDVVTIMLKAKETHLVVAELLTAGFQIAPKSAKRLEGYEIHMGETILGPGVEPFAHLISRSGEDVEVLDGAVIKDGRIFGTYLHGIFHNDSFRGAFLNRIRRKKGLAERTPAVQADPFDKLAAHLESSLDMERLLGICGIEV
ncbi:MAG: cobyric acid synthase [Geobacteraceae bacterium]|nr:cobyric acid synthase [Geobacteraceae bacterium]